MIPFVRSVVALFALLVVVNCSQTVEPEVSRSRVNPSADAAELASAADQACLAEAVYFEAAATPEAQAAVAHIILNRAEDSRFPKTVCGVVREGCQFSYRCAGGSLALKGPVKRTGAQRTAAAALTGAPDPTGGALFFHAAAVEPGWFGTLRRVGEIGGNVFYR